MKVFVRSCISWWGLQTVKNTFFFFFFFEFYTLYRLPYLGKATAATVAVLASPTSACWVFSCFRNPPNCDRDYRIFNVRMWSFLRVRIHTGVGRTHSESEQQFLTWKNSGFFFLCSWRGSNLGSLDLESNALPIEPPHHCEAGLPWLPFTLCAQFLSVLFVKISLKGVYCELYTCMHAHTHTYIIYIYDRGGFLGNMVIGWLSW